MQKWIIKDKIEEYLSVSEYINWKDAGILAKAEAFRQRCTDEISTVKAVYEFVRDEITHSWDAQDTNCHFPCLPNRNLCIFLIISIPLPTSYP